jgi:hypothetical protein
VTDDTRRRPPAVAARAGKAGERGRPAALVRRAALPAADVAGLAAAVAVSGAARAPLMAAVYAAGVLTVLAAGRLHRLRMCLRASDEAGPLLAAAAVPLPALVAWPSAAPRTLAVLALAAALFILSARMAAWGAPARGPPPPPPPPTAGAA